MMEEYSAWLLNELSLAARDLVNPTKRVSLLYFASALFFAFVLFTLRDRKRAWRRILPLFRLATWWSPSARVDYGLWLGNRLLFSLLFPKAITTLGVVTWLMFRLQEVGMSAFPVVIPDWGVVSLFSVCYFLLDDFTRFWVHWLMHRWPWLWAFHRVHHSATQLTPFTVLRTHPVEGVLFYLRSLVVQASLVSVFIVLFPGQVSLLTVGGVFVTTYCFNLLGANLRHSPVALSYGKQLERWLISPAQHQLHHSVDVAHYDCNFGVVLALWDRLFGCLQFASDQQKLHYGSASKLDQMGVFGHYWSPIAYLAKRGKQWLKSPAVWWSSRVKKNAKSEPKGSNISL
ncbi:sterol desaturase family protein [Marinomonas pollencensis]|uniref:Sterol desaturase/sphingolipid hydroxylase (Fatty acid hydroxylase superfamily) n=1 Tax=Marinomonas pollencensis TaxID=491954 RepID=A0A3E0DI97_9GAMM|nr:sterol desaturase family protein [Marinomonas pollencensis]REG81816.1 sterol desaturase/sphingolipid hydroxylase (fatty acid hydroxylase superfamily) [Marinomonas pollencensis]